MQKCIGLKRKFTSKEELKRILVLIYSFLDFSLLGEILKMEDWVSSGTPMVVNDFFVASNSALSSTPSIVGVEPWFR